DAEAGQREQEHERRDPAPPRPLLVDDRSEHVQVREPHRESRSPPLHEQVGGEDGGHDQERQQEEGVRETHDPPPQTRSTWTTARTPPTARPAVIATVTRPDRTVCTARTCATRVRLGGAFVYKPSACVAEISVSPPAHERERRCEPGATRSVQTRRAVGCPGGETCATVGIRRPPPAPGRQPMCGRKVDVRGGVRADVATKTAALPVVMPG